jgi:hypothetical protein
MLQARQAPELFRRYSDGETEMSFQSALAHSDVTRNCGDGGAAMRAPNHLRGCFNLGRNAMLRRAVLPTDSAIEKAFYRQELLLQLAGIDEDILEVVDLTPWQDRIKRRGPVVEKVDTVMQYCRRTNLSEANDSKR